MKKILCSTLLVGSLVACAAPPQATPTLPPAAPTQNAIASPAPLPTEPIPTMPATVSAQANGLQMVAGNWRLSAAHPDKDVLEADVCFQTPDDAKWYIPESTLTFNQLSLKQHIGAGPVENPPALKAEPQRCMTLAFRVPVNTGRATLTLTIPTLRVIPTFEQICGEVMPTAQRILDEQAPGVKIKCELTDLGYAAEVTHKPETMTLGNAQRAFEQASGAAYAELFAVTGPWVFSLAEAFLPRTEPITLGTLNPSPVALAISDIRRYPNTVQLQACFQTENEAAWKFGELVLEYAQQEVWLNAQPTPLLVPNCQTFSADVPSVADLTNAQVKLYSLQPAIQPECETYVPQLQTALEAQNLGIQVACDVRPDFWQLAITAKPASLSEAEARDIIMTDDLLALKGLWAQSLSLPALPASIPPAASEPFITAADRVKVRSGPATDYAQVGELLGGDVYRVLAQKDGWWQIDYGQPGGWVFGEVVEFSGEMGDVPLASK